MRRHRRLLALLLSLGLVACQQTANQSVVPAVSPGNGSSPARNAVPTATAQPSAAAGPTAQFPAPIELQGTWRALAAEDDELTLRIGATSYTLTRVIRGFTARGTGLIAVQGDEIVFSHANLCAGDGRYRWVIEGDVLRFTAIAPDPCSRALEGLEYTRDG